MRIPYNQTEGYVRNPASKARAVNDVRSGNVETRQNQILSLVHAAEHKGMTWREVQELMPHLHHGQISATLSVLHKAGDLFQVVEQRGKSHPYVHKQFRDGFALSQRIDVPAKTKANQMATQLAEARKLAQYLQDLVKLQLAEDLMESVVYEHELNATIEELIVLLKDVDEG